jgi:hypothetical protein
MRGIAFETVTKSSSKANGAETRTVATKRLSSVCRGSSAPRSIRKTYAATISGKVSPSHASAARRHRAPRKQHSARPPTRLAADRTDQRPQLKHCSQRFRNRAGPHHCFDVRRHQPENSGRQQSGRYVARDHLRHAKHSTTATMCSTIFARCHAAGCMPNNYALAANHAFSSGR